MKWKPRCNEHNFWLQRFELTLADFGTPTYSRWPHAEMLWIRNFGGLRSTPYYPFVLFFLQVSVGWRYSESITCSVSKDPNSGIWRTWIHPVKWEPGIGFLLHQFSQADEIAYCRCRLRLGTQKPRSSESAAQTHRNQSTKIYGSVKSNFQQLRPWDALPACLQDFHGFPSYDVPWNLISPK